MRVSVHGVDPDTGEIAAEGFDLEPPIIKGEVPQRVVDELVHSLTIARDHSTAYSDAAKAQAEKHGVKPAALKRYIAAIVADKLDEAEREADDLVKLLERDA